MSTYTLKYTHTHTHARIHEHTHTNAHVYNACMHTLKSSCTRDKLQHARIRRTHILLVAYIPTIHTHSRCQAAASMHTVFVCACVCTCVLTCVFVVVRVRACVAVSMRGCVCLACLAVFLALSLLLSHLFSHGFGRSDSLCMYLYAHPSDKCM